MSHRRLLEVVKFLDWTEVLGPFSLVSHAFLEAACEDEVWQFFIEQRDCEYPAELLAPTPKAHFKVTFQSFLPILTHQKLIEYHFATGKQVEHQLHGINRISHTSVWAWLPGNGVFCAGSEVHQRVYCIRPPEYCVEELAPMTQQRGWFAALYFRECVLAFGGFYTGWQFTKKCEKFDLRRGVWLPMPEMARARSSFNATRWKTQVFLCGGWENPESEVYDLQRETFSQLPLELPVDSRTLCWARNDVLFILQKGKVYKWSISGKKLESSEAVEDLKMYIWTNTPPVEHQRKLYYLLWDDGCGYSFDFETRRIKQVVPNLFPALYP